MSSFLTSAIVFSDGEGIDRATLCGAEAECDVAIILDAES